MNATGKSPDGKSPDGKNPDGKSPDDMTLDDLTAPQEVAAPRRVWVKVVFLAVLITGLTALLWWLDITDVEQVRKWFSGAGWLAPALYAALFAVVTLAFAPKTPFGIGAGLLFGFGTGIAVTLAGAVLGAALGFWLARLLGRQAIERWTGARVARVDAFLRRRGFVGVLGIRLVPLVPFSVVTYAGGLSAVGFLPYVLGTAIGTLPGSMAQVAVGAYGSNPWSWQFLAGVGTVVSFWIAGAVLARRHQVRKRDAGSPEG